MFRRRHDQGLKALVSEWLYAALKGPSSTVARNPHGAEARLIRCAVPDGTRFLFLQTTPDLRPGLIYTVPSGLAWGSCGLRASADERLMSHHRAKALYFVELYAALKGPLFHGTVEVT